MPKITKFHSDAASIASARSSVKPPKNKNTGNPGPPPWAKGAGPGLSSTPKTDKPKTILSAPQSAVGKLKSKAKSISSSGGSLGSIGGFQIKPTYGAKAGSAIDRAQSSTVFGGKRGKF